MEYTKILPEVIRIAREAGAAILDIYNKSEGIVIEKKADDSPLTLADKRANDIICEGLSQLPLQFPVVSEENKAVPYEERCHYEYFWLVDPLDGTKEFIKRNGEFTVNIALIHRQHPVMGVVYTPFLDEMYWACEGEGAWLRKGAQKVRLQANAFGMGDSGLGIVCSRSHLNEATSNFLNKLNQPEIVAKGSSLKFMILAKGEAQVYPRLGPTMEWDTGAAQIILEEAGGKVIDKETQAPLLYNKAVLRNPNFIAYGNVQTT